jgi:SulP family sulfate permease
MKNQYIKYLIPDLMAGLTVSFAALSLGAAFGEMSGRGAIAGMMGAAIIPIFTSLFGGTRLQASGPTAPMTAVSALLIAFAYESFTEKALAEQFITFTLLLSGVLMMLSGALRLGRYILLVPQVVVLGFMNGIAVLIWFDQLVKLFTSDSKTRIGGDLTQNVVLAFGTLLCIYLIPMALKKGGVPAGIRRFMPGILISLILFSVLSNVTGMQVDKVTLAGSFNSFGEFTDIIVSYFPTSPELFKTEYLLKAFELAGQLCLLGYLDSLLTSLIIDRIVGERTKHNKELFGQGLANSLSGLFQGIPGAQATIRSVLLIKEGAKTRLVGVYLGIFTLLGFLVFAPYISMIAKAIFVGILFKAGMDVFDRDFPISYFKRKWFSSRQRNIQLIFILYTTLMTVLLDLNVAVISGTVFFYVFRHFAGITDVEPDFADVKSDELHGQSVTVTN